MHLEPTLSKKILTWYDNSKRNLPWRVSKKSTKKVYYRLLSEFMLQQTQVKTVIPYFNKLSDEQLIAETFVGSKELTVTVLKESPLCVTEITTFNDKEFYNYKAKYDKDGSFHKIPADIPKVIYKKALSWALKAHQIIGCKGISRTDFRYDENNETLYMLELNTQPGMTKLSLVPEIALYKGITFIKLIEWMLKDASKKK